MALEFFVEGKPVGYKRSSARFGFTPPDVMEWRANVALCYLAAVREPYPRDGGYTGPVALSIRALGSNSDLDNLAKEIQDALMGVAYLDDSQVVDLHVLAEGRVLTSKGRPRRPKGIPMGAWITVVLTDLEGA